MPLTKITAPPPSDLFRSAKALSKPGELRVDRKKNVIYGAAMMQLGQVNDSRPWHVDDMTLDQVVELAAQSNKGLKARFTHPNMSSDGLGYYLGRWHSVRRDGEFARGDLHFAKTAFTSPHGDLATYLLDLAEEAPEDFGISLAGWLNHTAMERTSVAHPDGLEAVRYRSLTAGDVVDDPAATRTGLFASRGNIADLPELATRFLDHYFSAAEPATVRSKVAVFLDQYLSTRKGTDDMPAQAELDAKQAELDKANTELASKTAELKKFSDERAAADKAATEKAAADKAAADKGTQLSAEQKVQIEREAVLAENKRVSEITALCNEAGFPELVAQFTKADGATTFTVAQAKSELMDATLRRSKAQHLGDGGDDKAKKDDADVRFGKEYDKNQDHHLANDVTRERYIHARKIDEGLVKAGTPLPKKE